jgi:hypothetical protein
MDKPNLRKTLCDIIDQCQPLGYRGSIHIKPLTRGYEVSIGCASFAFEKLGDMIEALNLFLDDQVDAEKAFNTHMAELLGVDTTPSPQSSHAGGCEGDTRQYATAHNPLGLDPAPVRVGYPDGTETEDTETEDTPG